ncbi:MULTISPECIES: hypothetical protein [Kitasatospora]|uniref:hypothetical protein n=1 Tax=Kitasatospora TaxID=2063 RepID=UPI000A8C08B9|nr:MULTISPECIES: hypothetical protein [Kitasatospora]
MRRRSVAAAVLAGLSLAFAVPAAAHAARGPQITMSGSWNDTATIEGTGLSSPKDVIWDGDTSGSVAVGGQD